MLGTHSSDDVVPVTIILPVRVPVRVVVNDHVVRIEVEDDHVVRIDHDHVDHVVRIDHDHVDHEDDHDVAKPTSGKRQFFFNYSLLEATAKPNGIPINSIDIIIVGMSLEHLHRVVGLTLVQSVHISGYRCLFHSFQHVS